ncbi:MAG: hypothetical protein IT479_10500 [Xanthomonadales bacterium]|nr:hypothetical protein [Xanthomonadales bacterium]MCC6593693.1 hypothetical protein [Xanthomonadales bacterium]MCE7932553.1 hypothetical protein [Xanthomonadales bacterium PRO6]
MHSSSAYAAPVELDLRPGRIEVALRWLLLAAAVLAIALTSLGPALQSALGLLAGTLAWRDWRVSRRRPVALRLHADGGVAASSDALQWLPCALAQAHWFLGLPILQWRIAGARTQACVLFPDRVDAATRQRLRVWLQTHAPGAAEAAA